MLRQLSFPLSHTHSGDRTRCDLRVVISPREARSGLQTVGVVEEALIEVIRGDGLVGAGMSTGLAFCQLNREKHP